MQRNVRVNDTQLLHIADRAHYDHSMVSSFISLINLELIKVGPKSRIWNISVFILKKTHAQTSLQQIPNCAHSIYKLNKNQHIHNNFSFVWSQQLLRSTLFEPVPTQISCFQLIHLINKVTSPPVRAFIHEHVTRTCIVCLCLCPVQRIFSWVLCVSSIFLFFFGQAKGYSAYNICPIKIIRAFRYFSGDSLQ